NRPFPRGAYTPAPEPCCPLHSSFPPASLTRYAKENYLRAPLGLAGGGWRADINGGKHMAKRFEGKSILVTGAASGIGRAAALAFGAEGGRVTVVDRSDKDGEATAKAIRDAGGAAIFFKADVKKIAAPPASRIAFAVASPSLSLRSTTVTRPPSAPNASAAARPMPDAAPVTRMDLPSKRFAMCFPPFMSARHPPPANPSGARK